jgi:hypothetical protein
MLLTAALTRTIRIRARTARIIKAKIARTIRAKTAPKTINQRG